MRKFWNRCAYVLILQFVLVAAGSGNTLTVDEAGNIIAETDRYEVRFRDGVLTHFHNKLTNETYTLPPQGPSNIVSTLFIQYHEESYGRDEPINERWDVETIRLAPLAVEVAYHSDYKTEKTVRLGIAIDLVVVQL